MIKPIGNGDDALCFHEQLEDGADILKYAQLRRKADLTKQRDTIQLPPRVIVHLHVLHQRMQRLSWAHDLMARRPAIKRERADLHAISTLHDIRVFSFHHFRHARDGIRIQVIIAVHQHAILSLCFAQAIIARGAHTVILGAVITNLRIRIGVALADRIAAILRSVTDDDDLYIFIALCQQGAQTLFHILFHIIDRYDHN